MIAAAQPVAAEQQVRRIEMKDVAFVPPGVVAHAGDVLEWHNDDIVAHTATSRGAGFDLTIMPGHRGRVVLTRAGTFSYICRFHPNMTGQVTVVP